MKTFPLLCLLCLFPAVLSAEEIVIAPERIVISAPQADDPAAQELKTHLELITGKKIPLLTGGQVRPGAFVFHVGEAPAGAPTKFQPEESRWDVTPSAAWFYGESKRSRQNAVCDFLESELGVRWPGGADIAFRKQDPLRLKIAAGQWIPEVNMRNLRCAGKTGSRAEALLWRRRLRAGGHDQPRYGHAFTQYWKRFGKTHPDYFAMRADGLRAPVGVPADKVDAAAPDSPQARKIAMCVGNPALAKQVIADWQAARRPLYINLCENDAYGNNYCRCPRCTAPDVVPKNRTKWENWYADRYVRFANGVLAEAKKSRPDVKAAMYAYNGTEQPPAREKPHPDLVVGIIPTIFTQEYIRNYVGSWKKAGLNRFFYRPNRHFYYELPLLPAGSEKHFFEIWQYLYKSGAIGFDYDGPAETSPFQYFGNYVLLKAMQDPAKPFEYWEKHYMQAFGKAAEDIRSYFRYWREKVWDARLAPDQAKITEQGRYFNFARGLLWNLDKYYRESDFTEAGKYLEAALSRELTPEERARIKRLRFTHEHARLFRNAAAGKSRADSLKLLTFREKHKLTVLPRRELYFGDICGIGLMLAFKDYLPPYLKMPLIWNFRLDPEDKGIREKWYQHSPAQVRAWGAMMCTDSSWENPRRKYKVISDAIRKQTANYDGVAWYGTEIQVPSDWKNRQIFLYFGAVDESCRVYVNGREAGVRIFKNTNDWNTPFTIRIDPAVDWNKPKQSIIVRVEDKAGQGGIWKPVWLISRTR